jgi:signal transduction histidine kinase
MAKDDFERQQNHTGETNSAESTLPVSQHSLTEVLNQRIAHELHDGPIQDLSALVLKLENELDAPVTMPQKLMAEVKNEIVQVITALRFITGSLRVPDLIFFGLQTSLLIFLEDFQKLYPRPAIQTDFDAEAYPLPESTALALYRICQHALRNVLNHARANTVSVRLHYEPDRVILEIEDDGQGFDVPQPLE